MGHEKLLTEFVSVLANLNRAMNQKAVVLAGLPGVSNASFAFWFSEPLDPTPDPSDGVFGTEREVSIKASIEASLERVHGISWSLDVLRRGSGWEVNRSLSLHATNELDDIDECLPDVLFDDSVELTRALPSLVAEWLAMPLPPLQEGDR
jgi:hypothetical protein